MKNTFKFLVLFAFINVFISCEDDQVVSDIVSDDITLNNHKDFGLTMTDKEGKSLYFFSKDVKGTSACKDGCLTNWPIFYSENLKVAAGVDILDFGTITREDGKKQTTYKGWPLYYFLKDVVKGDVKGENLKNVWFLAKPNYSLMYAKGQLVGDDGKMYTSNYTEGIEETSYITDTKGRTIYTFVKDTKNTNNFTKSDFSNNGIWIVLEVTLGEVPSVLSLPDFGVIDVFGKKQLTYKNRPLYYFWKDTQRGDNKGVSVPEPTKKWPIVNVDTTPLM